MGIQKIFIRFVPSSHSGSKKLPPDLGALKVLVAAHCGQ